MKSLEVRLNLCLFIWQRPFSAHAGMPRLQLGRHDKLAGCRNVLLQAVQSPVIVVSVLVSVWNLLNDPPQAV